MTNVSTTEAPAGSPTKRVGGMSARVVLHAVRRHPLILVAAAALGGGAAAAVWFFLPLPKATAAVVFHIATQAPTLLAPTAEARTDFVSYKQSQAALVKRRLTLNAALKQPGIGELTVIRKAEPDALTWLDKNIKADVKTGAEFMQVTLEGDNGEELRAVLDAIAKAYLADVDERDNGARRRRLARLEDTHRAYRKEVERYQSRIDTIALALGSKDGLTLAAMESIQQEDLRVASRDLSAAREQLQLAELGLAGLDAADAAKPGDAGPAAPAADLDALVDEELRKDPVLRDLDAAVTKARQALSATEKLFQPGANPPAVVRAREQLTAAEAARDNLVADRRPKVEALLKEGQKKADRGRRDELRRAAALLSQKADLAKARVEDVQQKIAKGNEYRIELENLKRMIDQTDKLSSRLADEIEQVKVELGAPTRVNLSEEPFVIPGLEGSRRLKFTLIAGFAVCALGFAGLVGWEVRSHRVTHPSEVTTDLGVRLLGTVPPLTGADAEGLPQGARGMALIEAIDTARTMLLHGSAPGLPMRTLVVTSAVAGEGKTSFSGHLAISLARAGYRTLLVDADMQSPSAHRLFELEQGPGLCELLRGQADARSAIQPSPLPGLSVLPAGKWDLTARQALVGDGWRRAKRELESQFDFLVIDTAPLLLVTDTLLLAREADGVILSVLQGVSQVAHVAETTGRLQALGVTISGAVVSGVWHKAYRSGYGYGRPGASAPGVAV